MLDPDHRSDGEPSLQVGQTRRPKRRRFVRDHHQWSACVLCLVPGVKDFFLVPLFGVVEEPSLDPLHEASREQAAPRAPWASQDGSFDGPQAPAAEMLESLAVGVRDDEAGVAFGMGPVERKRDLVRPLLHCWLPVLGACAAGVAGCCGTGGGGSGGGLPEADFILTTFP